MNEAKEKVVNGEVIHVGALANTPPAVDLMAVLEQRNNYLERVLDYAIRATHPEQWFDQGGKPWPTRYAAEVMARRCGVSVTNLRMNKQPSHDDKGDFYIYVVEGTASLPSGFDELEAIGTCSSRDQFLGTETSAGRSLSEIDEGNIMKAAYSNLLVNAITRLLGVAGLSWDRLKEAGLDREKMGKVEYDSGSKGGGRGKAEGADLMIKFGNGKDKTIGQQTDDDLAWYVGIFEKDLKSDDPKKVKHKANTEKQLAAAKAEQARRANAKAGTAAAPATSQPSFWERLKQLAGARNVAEDRLKALTKHVLQTDKVTPSELTEAQFSAIADALAKEPAEAAKKETF